MNSINGSHPTQFERDLTSLLLDAFSSGAKIQGQWEIEVPLSSAPNWTVTIEKHAPETDPAYEPQLLEE